MVKLKTRVSIGLVGMLLMMLASSVFAATITATVDRSQASAGESIQLTLNIKGSPDGAPDFAPLQQDFDIVSQNQSSNMQIINGNISRQRLWVLTLMPKHEGDITIPSIHFGSDRSNAVTIHVNAAQVSRPGSVADDIFLQVDAEPKDTFVQAQVIYTVKVYVATNINNASLSEPRLSDADAVVKKLGKDRRFDTNYLGRSYQVVERRYAIFPQQSGKLRISPLTFNAQVIQQPSGFGMNIFQQFGRNTRLRSEAVNINVKPIPATQQLNSWLPAAKIQLQDAWTQDPSKFRVGDAITRTVTLTAEGLTAAQLPKIISSTPDGFKVYPDQAALHDKEQDSGITGVRTEKMAMIASRPGHYVIPAITLHWWNTQTHKQETALIPQRKIEVLPALPGTDTTPSTPSVATPQTPPAQAANTPAPSTPLLIPQVKTEIQTVPGFWPWLTAFLALGWLVTLVVLILVQLRNKRQPNNNGPVNAKGDKQESLKYIEKNLELTCEQGDPQAVKTSLLKWGATRFPDKKVTSLSDLAELLGEPAATQIKALNQVLYSPSAANWQGRALWDAIQNTNKKQPDKTVEEESLAPLYP